MTEKENQNLRLAKENLCKEKEKAELERDKKTLETANLKLEIAQLESERDNLIEYKREQSELSKPIHDVINVRLDMLNSLLAKEIANNDIYAKPYVKWIESIHMTRKSLWTLLGLPLKHLILSLSHIWSNVEPLLMKSTIFVYMLLVCVAKRLENISK